MARALDRRTVVALAVKLVSPGRLADVTDGVTRLLPATSNQIDLKTSIKAELMSLIQSGIVAEYTGQRYELTEFGQSFVADSGISYLVEVRRMYLLKETRKASVDTRSGTRDRSLQQWPKAR